MNTLITNEERDARYDVSPQDIQFLYTNKESGHIMRKVFEQNGLPQELYTDYALILGDIILGFYPKGDLKKMLIDTLGISDDIAQKIEIDLKQFLSKVDSVPSIPAAEAELKEKLELRPRGVPLIRENGGGETPSIPTPPPANTGILGEQKPLTREAILGSLTPARTMANDIASLKRSDGKMHGYEAYVTEREQKNTETPL